MLWASPTRNITGLRPNTNHCLTYNRTSDHRSTVVNTGHLYLIYYARLLYARYISYIMLDTQAPLEYQVYPQSYMRSESLLLRSDCKHRDWVLFRWIFRSRRQVDYCIFFLYIYNILCYLLVLQINFA